MARLRLAMLLPVFFTLLTSALWLSARAQYKAFIRSTVTVDGSAQDGQDWPESWTDYTPVSLEIAGALNVPVATFAYPLYQLLHKETSNWKLLGLLLGVTAQWAFVGWVFDTRKSHARPSRLLAVLGVQFGVFVLLVSTPMYHVALIYKGFAVLWSISICWYCGKIVIRRSQVG